MAGRIRSLKPEWLEDELLIESSSDARVLSAALILLADDYGNGRGGLTYLHSRAFPGQDRGVTEAAVTRLQEIRFMSLYEVDGQRYFTIRNWKKHQKVDKPGKPLVPPPTGVRASVDPTPESDLVYFVQQGTTGHIKIGRSWNPVDRIRKLSTASSAELVLLGVIDGGYQERELHKRFEHLRVKKNGEWFKASEDLVSYVRERSRPVREQDANSPEQDGDDSEPVAPDRDRRPGPTTYDQRPTTTREAVPPVEPVEDPGRETVCPLDLFDRAEKAGVHTELAEKLPAPIEAVRHETREFVKYWTIGKGGGRRKAGWMRWLRQRICDQHGERRLKAPGALGHEAMAAPAVPIDFDEAERQHENRAKRARAGEWGPKLAEAVGRLAPSELSAAIAKIETKRREKSSPGLASGAVATVLARAGAEVR
jgi:hypothetical protein